MFLPNKTIGKEGNPIIQQLRILIGDDGTAFARSLAMRLRKRDCVCSAHRQSVSNFIRSIQMEQPHAIIIDITDKSVDHCELLKEIRRCSDAPVFAVTVTRNAYLEKLLWQEGLSNIWRKPLDEDAILREIRVCLHGSVSAEFYRSLSVESLITELLQALGVPANMAGYRYLLATLQMTVENPALVHGICKNVYPDIAKRFRVNVPCVERNIRGALAFVWNSTNSYVISEVLGYPSSMMRQKLSNARFIACATERLRMDYRMQKLLEEKETHSAAGAI